MTNAKIFLVNAETKQLTPIAAHDYINEDQLQAYLADYPDLLAGDQIDPDVPRRWLLIAREVGIPGEEDGGNNWSLDHLFIDQDGMPTFVECKRAVDTRTRREVVAQMLDYAANGTAYWSLDRIRMIARTTAEARGRDLDDMLIDLLQDGMSAGQVADESIENFWRTVEDNLRNGRVRLLFVVDEAPRELRRLVEFLNDKMTDVQVLIVEIKQYTGAGQIALVPRVLGQSQQTADRKAGSTAPRGPNLTPDEFLARCSPGGADICRQIWAHAASLGYDLIPRKTAIVMRAKRPDSPGYSTLLFTIIGSEPGRETVEYFLDDTMRHNDVANQWFERLQNTGLFRARSQLTCTSRPLGEIDSSQILDLSLQLLDAGPDMLTTSAESAHTVE